MAKSVVAYQKCINPACGAEFDCGQSIFKCPQCGDLLDIQYNWDKIEGAGEARRRSASAGPSGISRWTSPACGGSASC